MIGKKKYDQNIDLPNNYAHAVYILASLPNQILNQEEKATNYFNEMHLRL